MPLTNMRPMRLVRELSIWIACVAWLSGCPSTNPACETGGDASIGLTIGTINPNDPQSYRALANGDSVYLVPGAQGGQHVWIRVHGDNLCATHPRVRLTVMRASDDAIIGFSQFGGNTWAEVPGSNVTYTSPAYAAAIDADKYCSVVHGGAIRIRVQVDDTFGHSAEQTTDVVISGWSPDASPTEQASRDACCADYTNTMCWPLGPPDAGD